MHVPLAVYLGRLMQLPKDDDVQSTIELHKILSVYICNYIWIFQSRKCLARIVKLIFRREPIHYTAFDTRGIPFCGAGHN